MGWKTIRPRKSWKKIGAYKRQGIFIRELDVELLPNFIYEIDNVRFERALGGVASSARSAITSRIEIEVYEEPQL